MWTNPGWFIYQLEVRIWFWSSGVWPPAFLYLSLSTLYSRSLWRTDTIVCSKLNKPPSRIRTPSLFKPPPPFEWTWNIRGFTVVPFSCAFSSVENPDCWSGGDLKTGLPLWYPTNRPFPSSKNPYFQNEAKSKTFLLEVYFHGTKKWFSYQWART